MLAEAHKAATAFGATLVDMRFVKPLDVRLIDDIHKNHNIIVTIEDNAIAGGAGSAVNEYILSQGKTIKILRN